MLRIIMGGILFAGIPIFIADRADLLVHKFAIIGGIIAFAVLLLSIIKEIKMINRRFSTIGRELYPEYEMKICCSKGTDFLDNECLNERFRIIYIKEGHGVFRNGEDSQIVTSPAVLCLNERDDVEIYNTSGLKLDVMYFEPTCFERYVTFENLEIWKSSLNDDAWFFRPFFTRIGFYTGACATNHYLGNRISQLIELADKELTVQKDEFWPCRSRSYFIELLLLVNSIYDEDGAHDNIYFGKMTDEIKDVVNWLHIHYLEKITMEVITRQFHTNKTTLNQKFKVAMDITVMEYICSLRMQIACSFLRKTYLPVNEIMERAGYRDDAHFLRTFKKYAGCTPTEYRGQFTND